jgi:hypothetical protein
MHHRQIDIDLFRGALRKVRYAAGKSSYPFISGDTYAGICDYRFNQKLSLADIKRKDGSIKLFLPANLKDRFLSELTSDKSDFSRDTLIIHNEDNIPSSAEMNIFSKRFKFVYSVNWLGDKAIATPIPIGLENWSLLRNGVPADFLRLINQGLNPTSKRSIRILSSFSIETNPTERSKAIEFAKSNNDVFQMPTFTSPKKYREMLSNSAFVLSPPGNGVDCHRTWEALYLGAIPIVLKKYWPFSHLNLPVLVVEEWSNIPEMIAAASDWNLLSIEELRREFLTFP